MPSRSPYILQPIFTQMGMVLFYLSMYLGGCLYDSLEVFMCLLLLFNFPPPPRLAQINFFKMGSENLSEQLEEFLTNIGTSVQK